MGAYGFLPLTMLFEEGNGMDHRGSQGSMECGVLSLRKVQVGFPGWKRGCEVKKGKAVNLIVAILVVLVGGPDRVDEEDDRLHVSVTGMG